ncbi:MAG: hypothetical protein KKD75_01355 [Nanoarchaeota archaeon]|nr:hypothetical protein [Nanoarchaeota archaeon]
MKRNNLSKGNYFRITHNPCNRSCSNCFKRRINSNFDKENEQNLVNKIMKKNKSSNFFLFPNEATTSPYLFDLMVEIGQKYSLSNGLLLDERMVDMMLIAGLESVKVTYFANAKEQIEWQNITENQYLTIEKNIKKAVDKGLNVSINNVLWRDNIDSILDLTKKCFDFGVSRVQLIRFRDFTTNEKYILDCDMNKVVEKVENAKLQFPNNPRIQFTYPFAGPNFFGKSFENAKEKLSPKEWVNSPYLCPAIDQNYWGISLKSNLIYWCLFIAGIKMAEIGTIDQSTGDINISTNIDLSAETLREKLRGKCSKDNCEYQSLCLGACRSTAYLFAKMKGENDPIYADMDICLTKVYERFLRR